MGNENCGILQVTSRGGLVNQYLIICQQYTELYEQERSQ